MAEKGITPPKNTLSLLRFRNKHSELSRIYWTHVIGAQTVEKHLSGVPDSTLAISALKIPTTQAQYGYNAKDTKDWIADYLGRSRLHILAICSANLEAFLKQITFAYVASLGHKLSPGKLSPVGEALAAPVLEYDSLPVPLEYCQELFQVDFSESLILWKRAYKIRCALVHNGGVVTARTAKDLGIANLRLHDHLTYTWDDLKADLNGAYHIANTISKKVNKYSLRFEEIEHELVSLKAMGALPAKEKLWTSFHDEGAPLPKKSDRPQLIRYCYEF